jgi:hypothetical protein
MNLLGIGARASKASSAPLVGSAMRIQRSVNGAAVPVVYGTTRLPGNLIWYGDFKATPVKSGGKSGGKGGMTGTGAKGQAGKTTYQASFAIGLAAGTIQGIGRVWDTTGAADTPASIGGALAIMSGAAGQSPWSYLAANHPDQALGYSGLAYVGIANLALGESPSLPNLSFEAIGFGPAATPVAWSVPPGSRAWSVAYTPPSYAQPPFAAIAAVLKTPPVTANIVFDTSPAFCIADLLTSTSYGAGLAPNLIGDLTQYATWCQAAGLAMSAALTESRDCRSILRDWLDATLADAFWSQGQIKIGAYADTPVTGTAADGSTIVFTPNLTPAMTIDDTLMLPGASDAGPLTVTRKDPAEVSNRFTVEYADRDSDYNTVTVTADDTAHIAAYGLRPASDIQADFITVGATAQTVADLRLARETGVLATYEWRMRSPGELLEPFDIVAISDAALGLSALPVRVTEVEEEDDSVFHITAEDIPGVLSAMAARPLAAPAGAVSSANADPGNVNAPIVFEPPAPLCLAGSGLEIWALISGADSAQWGGCDVWVSTGQANYAYIGTSLGAARMGTLTAPLAAVTAAASGPTYDAANTLAVDLSESDGELISTDQASALALNSLCIVDGELIAYTTATLSGPNAYALTGLVRGAYGTQVAAHAAGAAFARVDGAQFRYPITPDRIGQTVNFKFLSFNASGGGGQTLDEVEPYAYTILGSALASPLASVTGLATAYQAGLTTLSWNPVADPRPIDYELRLGTVWDTAQTLWRTSTPQSPILGDGTYWVAAHFKIPNGRDIYSPVPAAIAIAGSALTSNVIATRDQAAEGWLGTCAGTQALGGKLWLLGAGDILADPDILATPDIIFYGGVAAAGSYTIPAADRIALSGPATCNVMMKVAGALGYFANALDITKIADITQVGDLLGVAPAGTVWAQPQIRLSQDGVSWGAWQNWIPGSYTGMAFDARIILYSTNPEVSAQLADFVFAVDVPDRVDRYSGLMTNAGTGQVTQLFQAKGAASPFAFNGGAGPGNTPIATFTVANGQPGDDPPTYVCTLSQITISTTAAGAPVSRQINNLVVEGY